MSFPTTTTAVFLDKILAFLAPLFLGTVADLAAARATAGALLVSYGAETNRELRLAA
ncbi:hypothetical protein [Rhodopila sp.]|uniref:hypothetical protein n=1 Tax=Rhodopila sp. TaxID=2480087 RepID=UPI003D12009B